MSVCFKRSDSARGCRAILRLPWKGPKRLHRAGRTKRRVRSLRQGRKQKLKAHTYQTHLSNKKAEREDKHSLAAEVTEEHVIR